MVSRKRTRSSRQLRDEVESDSPVTDDNSAPLPVTKRRGRGLAKKPKKWGKEKLQIQFNALFQPCGGDHAKLATQCGVFAKDGKLLPLTADTWADIPDDVKERIWKEIQDNTDVPSGYKRICLAAMGLKWKDFKHNVKVLGYDAYETDEERLANRPAGVVEEQWPVLVAKWGKEEFQKISEQNKLNHSKQEFRPKMGKTSFAVLIEERSNAGLPTDRLSNFVASRTDKEGHTEDRTTSHMIEKINDSLNELPEEERNSEIEREKIFLENFGKDGHGRMRCMGTGPTISSLYGRGSKSSYPGNVTAVRVEFEKKLEDQQEAHKLEIEAHKKEMEAQILAQKDEQKREMEAQREEQKREIEALKEEQKRERAAQMEEHRKDMEKQKTDLTAEIQAFKKEIMGGLINFQRHAR